MYDSSIRDQDSLTLCRLNAEQWQQPVTTESCQTVLENLDAYDQIANDNPDLIWLYTLMIESGFNLPTIDVIAAMKQRVLEEEGLSPMAWRYLAKGTADDFRIILDAVDMGDSPTWRWNGLVYWLQILTGLRRESPIPVPIQHLFYHDSLVTIPEDGEVQFRGVWMSFGILRHILNEAELRLAQGTLTDFVELELVDVLTWLSDAGSDLDSNQVRMGWKYLSSQAAAWKANTVRYKTYQGLQWDSAIPSMQVNQWTVEPVIDAWALHRLALSQRHCADQYIGDCIQGRERIFTISNQDGKTVASLRLSHVDGKWSVGDLRGFANSTVPDELISLGLHVASEYTQTGK